MTNRYRRDTIVNNALTGVVGFRCEVENHRQQLERFAAQWIDIVILIAGLNQFSIYKTNWRKQKRKSPQSECSFGEKIEYFAWNSKCVEKIREIMNETYSSYGFCSLFDIYWHWIAYCWFVCVCVCNMYLNQILVYGIRSRAYVHPCSMNNERNQLFRFQFVFESGVIGKIVHRNLEWIFQYRNVQTLSNTDLLHCAQINSVVNYLNLSPCVFVRCKNSRAQHSTAQVCVFFRL